MAPAAQAWRSLVIPTRPKMETAYTAADFNRSETQETPLEASSWSMGLEVPTEMAKSQTTGCALRCLEKAQVQSQEDRKEKNQG